MNVLQIIMRTLQFIWILLITALIGNVLAGKTSNNSVVNYSMFVAAFCWVIWFYGIAAVFVEAIAIPIALLVLDILATIFTFVAGVVLADKLNGSHSCNNRVSVSPLPAVAGHKTAADTNQNYLESTKILVDNGSTTKHCRELQASCAFFWFLFATFIGSIIITAFGGLGGSRGMKRSSRPAPAMAQV